MHFSFLWIALISPYQLHLSSLISQLIIDNTCLSPVIRQVFHKMNALLLLLLLFNACTFIFASRTKSHHLGDYLGNEFFGFAQDRLKSARKPEGSDSVFKVLREGRSLPISPESSSPTVDNTSSSDSVSIFTDLVPISRSKAASKASTWQRQVTISTQVSATTNTIPVKEVYDQLIALSFKFTPKLFGVFHGNPCNFIEPEFSQISHIFNFFNLATDLFLPLCNSSYLLIPLQISSPEMVKSSIKSAPSINSSIGPELLSKKLMSLHWAFQNDHIFENILAVQIDFFEKAVYFAVIFKNDKGSFYLNLDFFEQALSKFIA